MKTNCLFSTGNNGLMANLGLLVLRVWLGVAMLCNHGWDKLIHFSDKAGGFPDLIHIGSTGNLALALFAEVACSVLLVFGLVARFAALVLAINMTVAFVLVHKMALSGEHGGELAFLYLAGYVTLLIAGPGSYSADGTLFGKPVEN
jgi:putative oxidoreductase